MVQINTRHNNDVGILIIFRWGTKHSLVVTHFRTFPCSRDTMRIICDGFLPSLQGNKCPVLTEFYAMVSHSKRMMANPRWVVTHSRRMVTNSGRVMPNTWGMMSNTRGIVPTTLWPLWCLSWL